MTACDSRAGFVASSLATVRELVLRHLADEDVAVYLFGSRATRTAGRRSDIDVGVLPRRPLAPGRLAALREALDDLNVPYAVDLVDLGESGAEFRAAALAGAIPWRA